MSEKPEDLRSLMPTERKSMWRTAEARQMSDLTRVLEWMERRRRGKKKEAVQKHAMVVAPPKATEKEENKSKALQKQAKEKHRVSFPEEVAGSSTKRDVDLVKYRRLYSIDAKGKRLSVVPGNYNKEGLGKFSLDIKEAVAQESSQRSGPHHQQNIVDSMFQDTVFSGRKTTLLRDWVSKISDTTYERKLKSLLDKGTEPKVEMARVLKPEEVLSCRYLRLSKNNIRTLLKLCKDAGMDVEIHPHMTEAEIDAKKVFAANPTVAL